MALTPVRHVRVPDELWDAAKAKAESEYRAVSDVIIECLRRYVNPEAIILSMPPRDAAPAGDGGPWNPIPKRIDMNDTRLLDALHEAAGSPAVGTADTDRPPSVGTPGNGSAKTVPTAGVQAEDAVAAVPTAAPRKRKSRAKVTTAAELAKPPEEREDVMPRLASAVKPDVRYPCCKHCKGAHGSHGDPCLNGCHG